MSSANCRPFCFIFNMIKKGADTFASSGQFQGDPMKGWGQIQAPVTISIPIHPWSSGNSTPQFLHDKTSAVEIAVFCRAH